VNYVSRLLLAIAAHIVIPAHPHSDLPVILNNVKALLSRRRSYRNQPSTWPRPSDIFGNSVKSVVASMSSVGGVHTAWPGGNVSDAIEQHPGFPLAQAMQLTSGAPLKHWRQQS